MEELEKFAVLNTVQVDVLGEQTVFQQIIALQKKINEIINFLNEKFPS